MAVVKVTFDGAITVSFGVDDTILVLFSRLTIGDIFSVGTGVEVIVGVEVEVGDTVGVGAGVSFSSVSVPIDVIFPAYFHTLEERFKCNTGRTAIQSESTSNPNSRP